MQRINHDNKKFENIFGHKLEIPLMKKYLSFICILFNSKIIEEIILKICRSLKEEYKIKNLCLAGGVALNCVAMEK